MYEGIEKHRVSDLALQYGLAKSSICTITKNKGAIKEAKVAKGVMSQVQHYAK